jgi:hypothetical protein
MKIINSFILLTILAALLSMNLFSQSTRTGASGAAFLNIGTGAKNVALGSAYTAISNDVNQIFCNPAGIALKNQTFQAVFNYNKWICDFNHNSAAISYNLQNIGTFAFGIIAFGASDIPADRDVFPDKPDLISRQIDQQTSDTYNYMDMALSLSYSRYLINNLSLGITLKVISETIDDKNSSVIAFDVGSIYDIGIYDWKIAARLNNLGGDMKFYDFQFGLPLSFSIGTSVIPFKNDLLSLLFTLDAYKNQDGPQYFYSGTEISFLDNFKIRGGYKFNYSGTQDEKTFWRDPINTTIEGVSFGVGLVYPIEGYHINLDYSFTKMDLLDNVHRISLGFCY